MFNAWMTKVFGASWLTTVLALIGAVGTAIYPILTQGRFPNKTEWGIALLMALFGMATKAYNVTGGTKDNTLK